MFSTALPIPVCAAASQSLEIIRQKPELRQYVISTAELLRFRLRELGFEVPQGQGPIVPVILGTPERTLAAAAHLESQGFLVAAIRPPTVPHDTSRLRITVTAQTSLEDLAQLVGVLANVEAD